MGSYKDVPSHGETNEINELSIPETTIALFVNSLVFKYTLEKKKNCQ